MFVFGRIRRIDAGGLRKCVTDLWSNTVGGNGTVKDYVKKGGARGYCSVSGVQNEQKGEGSGSMLLRKRSGNSSESFVEHLTARMEIQGPIPVAQYMKEALLNPVGGYYMSKEGDETIGGEGDFITSPEISQMFGESLGLWFVNQAMQDCQDKKKIRFIELGPGKGTLASDIIRTFENFPKVFKGKLEIHLVDPSEGMRGAQFKTLCGTDGYAKGNEEQAQEGAVGKDYVRESSVTSKGVKIFWHRSIDEIVGKNDLNGDVDEGDIFNCIVAHEFFDALPVHQLVYCKNKGWRERLVDLDDDGVHPFRFILSPGPTLVTKLYEAGTFGKVVSAPKDGEEIELNLESVGAIEKLKKRFMVSQDSSASKGAKGAMLVIDYGDVPAKGNTVRAFLNHKECHLFENPGKCDVTADVNFEHLMFSAKKNGGVIPYGPVTQDFFLKSMGIELRAQLLARKNPRNASILANAINKLTSPKEMGSRFKFIALISDGCAPPAVFQHESASQ
eukprot:Nk52_evm25s239 gene=Nk52_evmTU25s239